MIHELDETLRQFVRRDALPGSEVDVSFEAPTKDWASRRTGPVVDLYLYDIREDTTRREFGQIVRRDDDGLVAERFAPPRWYKLSYLVTAWTQRPEDEHRLLSVVLSCFVARDSLPIDLLIGELAAAEAQVPYTCGLPPPQDRALSDVWSALGGELKPSLDLVLIAPFDISRHIEVGPPVEGPLGLDVTDLDNGGVDHRRPARTPWPGPARRASAAASASGSSGSARPSGSSATETSKTTKGTKPSSASKGSAAATATKRRPHRPSSS